MYEARQIFLIVTFILVCLYVTSVGLIGMKSQESFSKNSIVKESVSEDQISYFKNLTYFVLKDNKPQLKLDAIELEYLSSPNGKNLVLFLKPKGHTYSGDGLPVFYQGKKGKYTNAPDMLILEDNVFLQNENSKLTSTKLKYDFVKEEINGIGEVKTDSISMETGDKIKVESNQVYFYPQKKLSLYEGKVKGIIKRKRKYEDNINFKSDKLKMSLIKQRIDLNGNVYLRKKNLKAWGKKGEIFLKNYNKRLKYFTLFDDVKIVEKLLIKGSYITRKAFGEKLEGFPSHEKLVLTGYPKVFQQGDVIRGNKITLRENTEVVEVDDANTKFKLK
jgi:lipopolysaccharide transport protein LptA